MTFSTRIGGSQPGGGPSNGMTKIASGTITTPLAYLDLALPAGYVAFSLLLSEFTISTGDWLSAALSPDGGTTFVCDTGNNDSYSAVITVSEQTGNPVTLGIARLESLMKICFPSASANPGTINPISGSYILNPGSASFLASIFGEYLQGGFVQGFGLCTGALSGVINPAAVATPTPTRMNLIRLLPDGNGDCNPPTSGETIVTGTYILWGLKQ